MRGAIRWGVGSFAIASLLSADIPVPAAKSAADVTAITDSAAVGAPEGAQLGNAIFAALFGELTTAGEVEASADADSDEIGGEAERPDGKVPFGFDVSKPLPLTVRPQTFAGGSERGFEVAGFIPAAARQDVEPRPPEAPVAVAAERVLSGVPAPVEETRVVAVEAPLVETEAPAVWSSAARLPHEGRRSETRNSEEPDSAEERESAAASASVERVATPPTSVVPVPVREGTAAADLPAATAPPKEESALEVPVAVLGPPAPAIRREMGEKVELPVHRRAHSVPRAETAALAPGEAPAAPSEGGSRMLASPGSGGRADVETLAERSNIRVVAAGVREKGELAFTARVSPLAPEAPAQSAVKQQEPMVAWSAPLRQQAQPVAPVPAASTGRESSRDREEAPAPPQDHQPATVTALRESAHTSQRDPEIGAPRSDARHTPPATSAAELRSPLEVESVSMKPTAPAREIRLELAAGEGRVEVKLRERAGELKVAVRTADGHLADRLRADLRALSSRLEERGLRAETWQPAHAAAGEWRKTNEAAAANSGGPQEDPPGQQGREQQREGEPRRQPKLKEDEQPKEQRKDFEWFLSATQ
jgi:hypothetical protein